MRLTPPLNLPALGRRQPPYVVFTTLRRPVFLVNSRLGHFSATAFLVNAATLLPKLRVQFAEFLNESSHKRLRILTPPTCVGLRYGQITVMSNEAFLGIWGQRLFSAPRGVLSSPSLPLCGPDLPKPRAMTVQPDIHRRSLLPGCVPPRHCYWFRNFNRISIDYAFRPRLRCRLTLSRLTLLRKP